MSQPTQNEQPKLQLMTLAQAAKRIGKSERTLRRWIADGELRAFKVGPRTVAIHKGDLDAMVVPTSGRFGTYGPKAKVIDLSNVVLPVEGLDQ